MAQKEGKIDTASMLQSSPIAAGSTQITAAISSNFVTAGGPGAQTIDLRGLGPNRTLVLLNGRRAGPAGTRGSVSSFDLNVLPQSIVSRVDILKTGASSIYGSDAIAGVVNLITKTEMNGLQLDANISAPFDDGGEQNRLSLLWGKTFGRGHVMLAADFYKQNELARGDRDYLGCPEAYTFREDGSRADLIDPRTGQYKCEDLRWGHVWTYEGSSNPANRVLFLDDGRYVGPVVLMQYQYPGEVLGIPAFGAPTSNNDIGVPPGWFPTGYDAPSLAVQNSYHPFVLEQTIIPETKRYTLYGDVSYEITDNIEAFGEFLWNRRETYQNGWRQFWNFGFPGDFRGFGFGDPAAQGWSGRIFLSATGITNHADTSQKVDYTRGVGGLRGDLGGFMDGWSWDAHVQYSRSKGIYRTEQYLQEIYDQTYFATASCVGETLPISGKQCIDLPFYDPYFLRGEISPELADYMFDWEEGKTIYTQLNGEGILSGNLFELPAGPLGMAIGATVRRDEINDHPGEITLAGNAWGNSKSGITAGHSITQEAFGEISVPILADRPFFKNLSFSGAARVTNVTSTRKSDGFKDKDTGNWTYKLGGNWALNDWLRFRGTYGTSFRAPALFEQFLAEESSFPSQRAIDPCINWGANADSGVIPPRVAANCEAAGIPPDYAGGAITAESFSTGGIGFLDPETSVAKTASIVLTPTFGFLPDTRVSLAVDYFDIEVKGEVAQLGAANILFQCYNSETFPTDPLCSLFTRAPGDHPLTPFLILTVTDPFINIASQRNKGIDVTGNIRHNLGGLGSLNLLANMTWQLKDTFALFADTETSDNGEAGSPKWVGDFNLTWRSNSGGWTVFYGLDVIGKTSDMKDFLRANGDDPCIDSVVRGRYCPDLTTPTTFYHAASVTKEFGDKLEFTLGVTNIFDTPPPRVSVLNGSTISMIGPVVSASQYDFIGRRVFFNVSKRF
jgi:iron complex outermembrane receptor protein